MGIGDTVFLSSADRFAEGTTQLVQWVAEGKIRHRETIVDGLEQAPSAVNMLFDGKNLGKLIVQVAAVSRC